VVFVVNLLAYFNTVCLLNNIFIILLYMSYIKCTVAFTISFFAQISAKFMISSGRIVLRMSYIVIKLPHF